ncbi:hypothetical protein DPX16_9822 [Anabarilius grahami]|uniref:Secreted protein n=1 Tax=Anabarilius grahami TaxID=495550 RepID=A0A3N0Y4Z9_ANAGA|nr:hypothetical protein DPX16_9822 [Anabarilius grahami]
MLAILMGMIAVFSFCAVPTLKQRSWVAHVLTARASPSECCSRGSFMSLKDESLLSRFPSWSFNLPIRGPCTRETECACERDRVVRERATLRESDRVCPSIIKLVH